MPDTDTVAAPAGAGQVSLNMLGELLLRAALMFAGVLTALSLFAAADGAWDRTGPAEVRVDPARWMVVATLSAMALPLAWIARRWRSLHIAPSTPLAAGVAAGVIAGAAAAGISYPVYGLGQ